PPEEPCATLSSASITRESSPPEAISRSGPAGIPGFGAISNSTVSAPRGPHPSSRSETSTENSASGMASSARRSRTSAPSAGAAPERPPRTGARLRPRLRGRAGGRLRRAPRALQLPPRATAALRVLEQGGDRPAVLSLQAREQSQPFLDLLQAPRRALQALAV